MDKLSDLLIVAKKGAQKTLIKETLIKLIGNALFGKTLENVGKCIDIKLVTNKKALTKLTSQWNYKSLKSV